jgi:protein SCO1/2
MRCRIGAAAALTLVMLAAGAAGAADLSDLAFRPHPGAVLPLATVVTDEQGRAGPLGRFFAGKPVVLVLEYLRCRTLCGLSLRRVVETLDALPLDVGRDFELLAVDIDPRDTPAQALQAEASYLAAYRHPGGAAGMHFLTGAEPAVRASADAVGFPYRYDAATDQYLHPAGFVVAAPDGTLGRYFLGIGATQEALQAALAAAAAGRPPGPFARLLLLCRGDGLPTGRYTVPVLAALTVANLGGGAALVALFAALRRQRNR